MKKELQIGIVSQWNTNTIDLTAITFHKCLRCEIFSLTIFGFEFFIRFVSVEID